MADDLVKRLRDYTCDCGTANPKHLTWEAADRIQALEAALREIALMGPYPWRCIARVALGEKKE